MKEILDYLEYNYLICFHFDTNFGEIQIAGSSNRTISIEQLEIVLSFITAIAFILIKIYLLQYQYLKLLSKDKKQLSREEREILTSVIDQFKIMKRQFSEKYGILFDTAQILFILPLNWTEEQYKDKLHAFLLETEWITPKDNEKKLIMIPFISILTETFKVMQKRHLDRERTSLLFTMQPASEDDRVELSYTYFQMQSAKELIAVSKTLASSDYLLVPSIKSSNSIYLAKFQNVMHNAVKQILVGGKHSEGVLDGPALDEDELIRKIVCFLPTISDSAEWDYNRTLDSCAWSINWDKHQLQDLKSWSCGQFITTLMEDDNVKQYFKQVSNFLKGALLEYGAIKNSPDGIQHVLLYSHFEDQRQGFSHFIKQVLIEEDIILPRDEFIDINTWFNVEYAMQKPYKMIQIANAVLPPVIVNEDKQDDYVFQMDTRSDNLIAPNSFYVQANITDTHTSFILNKVVAPPSSKNAAKLFTVQERLVEIEDITEAVSHLLWNHYQSISDDKESRHSLFNNCQEHDDIALSFSHYKQFKKGIKEQVRYSLETKDTPISEGFDTYHLVSVVDEQCACTVNLSRRLLLEVGLKPVIANIAATVTSSLFSNDFFGRYQVSALIVKKDLKTINNPHFSYSYSWLLKEALQRYLQAHQRRVSLLFHDNQVDSKITQYLGRGEYSQVSSTTWIFKFDMSPGRASSSTLGVQEGSGCKRIPALPCASNLEGDESMSRYIVLNRGEDLPLAGINRNLLLKDCDQLGLEISASDFSRGSINQHRVWSLMISAKNLCSPISIKISPEHYSSTINICVSRLYSIDDINPLGMFDYSYKGKYVHPLDESVNIHERLLLKKH